MVHVGVNNAILSTWTILDMFCDLNATKGFRFPQWTPIDFQMRR